MSGFWIEDTISHWQCCGGENQSGPLIATVLTLHLHVYTALQSLPTPIVFEKLVFSVLVGEARLSVNLGMRWPAAILEANLEE